MGRSPKKRHSGSGKRSSPKKGSPGKSKTGDATGHLKESVDELPLDEDDSWWSEVADSISTRDNTSSPPRINRTAVQPKNSEKSSSSSTQSRTTTQAPLVTQGKQRRDSRSTSTELSMVVDFQAAPSTPQRVQPSPTTATKDSSKRSFAETDPSDALMDSPSGPSTRQIDSQPSTGPTSTSKMNLQTRFNAISSEWTTFSEGVWSFVQLPAPTEFAKQNVTEDDRKKMTPFDSSELAAASSFLADFVSNLSNGDIPSPADCRQLFKSYVQDFWPQRNGKKARSFFKLALSLYASPADVLPRMYTRMDKTCLPTSTLVELWLALFDLLGDKHMELVYSQGDQPWALTDIGNYHKDAAKSYAIPASPEATMSLAHDTIRSLSVEFNVPHTEPLAWRKIIETSLMTAEHQRSSHQSRLADLALLLAHLPPSLVPGFYNHSISVNQVSSVWQASNMVIGSLWALPTQPLAPSAAQALALTTRPSDTRFSPGDSSPSQRSLASSPSVTGMSKTKSVGFTDLVTKSPQDSSSSSKKLRSTPSKHALASPSSTSFFPIRAEPMPARVKILPRKNVPPLPPKQTYLTVSIPVTIESSTEYGTKLAILIEQLLRIWRALLEAEPARGAVLAFENPSDPEHPPLRQPQSFPNKSARLKKIYVEELKVAWSPTKQYTDLNFLLGHTNSIEVVLEHKSLVAVLTELQAFLAPDKLQCPHRCYLGNLLGPLVSEKSLHTLEQQVISSADFRQHNIKDFALEIRRHLLSDRLTKDEPRVFDIHVMCNEDQRSLVRTILRRMYPSMPKPRGSYPSGIQYRFMDEVVSNTRIVSPQKFSVAVNLRAKQKAFQASVISKSYVHIKHLHLDHPMLPGVNLAQNLLTLKSQKYPDRFLFLAIEQDYIMLPTIFHYSQEMEPEVKFVLPSLPLLCEGYFGSTVAKTWFHTSAWSLVEDEYGFERLEDEEGNPQGGRLFAKDTDPDLQTAQNWDVPTSDLQVAAFQADDFDIIISNMDVAILNSAPPVHILGDDGASTRTTGTSVWEPRPPPAPSYSDDDNDSASSARDSRPMSQDSDPQVPSLATLTEGSTPVSSLTANQDSDSSSMYALMLHLVENASFQNPEDLRKAQQFLHSRTAGRSP